MLDIAAFIALFLVVQQICLPISDLLREEWGIKGLISNWGIGILGIMLFDVLYIIPSDKSILFRFKLLYWLGIVFFTEWFLADSANFVATIIELINNPK